MKTTFLKPVFSLFAVAFAVFAAFAFSPAPEAGKVVDIWGHNPEDDCDVTSTLCSDNVLQPQCRIGTNGAFLYDMSSETDCVIELYRKVN
ncbi:DUF6520 family protein [Flavobacterium sp. UBA7682]|uniref:DUF6520 family protein n=1 Tax=Flavobacterium sp. UBA7682 TaxID=1946560 RepID=UPI0025BC9610|nr:DUF6520 family protein [Flavobacterium sp. UBA7682]